MARLRLIFKAFRELGSRQLGFYAWYRVLLRTGYLRWRTGDGRPKADESGLPSSVIRHILPLPTTVEIKKIIGETGTSELTKLAGEIAAGNFRRFGGAPVPIEMTPPGELAHWTDYEVGRVPWGVDDPKFIWEPARFGWVFILGQAYLITGNERYPEVFWQYFEKFVTANPVNQGPNWASAQEVALRILAFVFAAQIFDRSQHSTNQRISLLARAIADHAERIPPSILYARAQNNNHLLSEAVGLSTAGLALPQHPKSQRWQRLGWKWYERGIRNQIAGDGTYSQHSTNYHRLMLQLALWVNALDIDESSQVKTKIQHATKWLLSLADPECGCVPNLGPNDGAYILPLTAQPFADYRPVLQAASVAFLGKPAFAPGPWDDMSLWLSAEQSSLTADYRPLTTRPQIIRNSESWAYLRAAQFDGRPGHADQLHFDLWWRGMNIALDAGTFLYNAEPPWDNRLVSTAAHNTVMLNGRDQMTRAGRFLFLDRAQAHILSHDRAVDGSWKRIIAQQDGYRRFGAMHERTVTAYADGRWIVEDVLDPARDQSDPQVHLARLHWLLPDWEYESKKDEGRLNILSPHGWISLTVSGLRSCVHFTLIRAGEVLFGEGEAHPTWGWHSPTYAHKEPALSFSVAVQSSLPIHFRSEWRFPK